LNWLKRLFASAPVDGQAGKARGYLNTTRRIRAGMDSREAAYIWANADPPQDDYDQGVLDALADGGFKDPCDGPGS
jgi:hypothetical protein